MSADKDRGIRRIKQKRAKEQKRQERQQRSAGATQTTRRHATHSSAGLSVIGPRFLGAPPLHPVPRLALRVEQHGPLGIVTP